MFFDNVLTKIFIDVFGHLSNISLVYDFMDTDLEVIIKDSSIVFTQSHIKAYAIMTLKGLEYLHMNWILHRVRIVYIIIKNKKRKTYISYIIEFEVLIYIYINNKYRYYFF